VKKLLKNVVVLMVGVVLTIVAGCTAGKSTYSGFLGNYPIFKPGPKDGADLVYFKENVDFRAYNKVMLDQVTFYFKKDSKYKGVNPQELKEFSDAFHLAIFEALKGAYPLVSKPGPDVLRIRVAITDLVPSKPALNAFTAVSPTSLAVSFGSKAVTGKHSFVGAASMEAEFLDSQTNERIAAVIDTKSAEKYKVIKGMKKWGHAKDAFEYWAKRLRQWLDEKHGRR
jgi:hypothetical protein